MSSLTNREYASDRQVLKQSKSTSTIRSFCTHGILGEVGPVELVADEVQSLQDRVVTQKELGPQTLEEVSVEHVAEQAARMLLMGRTGRRGRGM